MEKTQNLRLKGGVAQGMEHITYITKISMLEMVRSNDTIGGILSNRYSLNTPYGRFSAVPLITLVAENWDGLLVKFEIKRINIYTRDKIER